VQKNRAAQLEQQRAAQQTIVDGIRAQIKLVLDNSKQFDSKGNLLPADELAKQGVARQEAMRKIAETALSSSDLDLAKSLGLADFVNRYSADLKLNFDLEEGLQKARDQVQQAFKEFKVKINLDLPGNTPDEVARNLIDQKNKNAEKRSTLDAGVSARQGASDTVRVTEKAASESLGRIMGRGGDQDILQQYQNAVADPKLTIEKVKRLADLTKPLVEQTSMFDFDGLSNINDWAAALEALIKKAGALKTLQTPAPADFGARFVPNLIPVNSESQTIEKGGSTYSTSVGDIIVNESKNGQETAREILSVIRRELRRGASSFA